MLNDILLRLDNDGQVIPAGNLRLREAFANPELILNYGIEPYLKGLTEQAVQEIDALIVDDVRNFLFAAPPPAAGCDLAARHMQRGRDHRLPDYNLVRTDLGFQPVKDFDDMTSDAATQMALSVPMER